MMSVGVVLGRYRPVLRTRQVGYLVSAMVAGRLPNGMRPLAMVLLVHQQQGSYATSGAALAALMVGTTVSAPFRGRAVDRWGQTRVLVGLSALQAATLAGFVAAALTGQGVPLLMLLAASIGATGSTLGGSMRALWPVLMRSPKDLQAAYALQALLEDLIAVAGPLLAALVLVIASPAAVLTISGIAGLCGTLAFVAAPASRSAAGRTHRRTSRLGVLSAPGMRVLAGALVCIGAVMGVVNVAVPAFAQEEGTASAAGVLLAVMSASSAVSGLFYGGRSWRAHPGRRFVWLAAIFTALVAPLAAAGTVTQLGALLILVGIGYAPCMITAYLLLDDLAPAGTLTEAYSWLVSANAGGIALGSALAGTVVQYAGVHWALALAGASAATGLALTTAFRRTLESGRLTGA